MKWEHMCKSLRSWRDKKLMDAGNEGWELVTVDTYALAYFKRPLEEVSGSVKDEIATVIAEVLKEATYGEEEKEAALEEEENKEDQGESEGASFVCCRCNNGPCTAHVACPWLTCPS